MTDYPTPEGERIITTAPMSLERARKTLEEAGFAVHDDGELGERGLMTEDMGGIEFPARMASGPRWDTIDLQYTFTADQLEALAVWMRAHAKEGG